MALGENEFDTPAVAYHSCLTARKLFAFEITVNQKYARSSLPAAIFTRFAPHI